MLSENFNKLLEIQLERYEAILEDCTPYVDCDHTGDASVHKRIVDDVVKLQSLTKEFMTAAREAESMDQKKAALMAFGESSKISTGLWDYLYKNIDEASPFRRKALLQHADIMGTIRMENITTNVTIGWNLLDEMLKNNRPVEQDNKTNGKNNKKPGPNLRIVK